MTPRPVSDPLEPIRQLDRALLPAALALIAARLAEAGPPSTVSPPITDRLLSVEVVCERLGQSKKWLYRHQRELGAVKLSHSKLGIPESRLAAFLANGGG